jgi:hypothetical protein
LIATKARRPAIDRAKERAAEFDQLGWKIGFDATAPIKKIQAVLRARRIAEASI